MRECTHGDKVNSLLGIVADGVIGDAAARLCLIAASDDIHRLLRIGHTEVVEHDAIHATVVEHLLQLIERAHLNLDLQVEALLLQVFVAAVDGIGDAASEIHVVVLQQDHVKKTDTVVASASDLHGLLLEHAHAGRRLAGVEHTCLRTLQPLYILVCHRGDTAHALHDVQHQALRLQQRAYLTCHYHGDVALLHTRTVAHQHLHLHGGVEAAEHLLGNLHTGEDAVFLDQQMRLAHRVLRDATERGMVTVTDILGKRQIDKSVNQFVNT